MDWIAYFFVNVLTTIARFIPMTVSTFIAKFVANIAYVVMAKRRTIALNNIDLSLGGRLQKRDKKRIARKSFEHAAVSFLELFVIDRVLDDIPKRFEIIGGDEYKTALGQGHGVVLAISHLGSWEYLSFICSLFKVSGTVVVKQIKNSLINGKIDQLRRKTTVVPVPKQSASRHVLTELKQNHTVAILIDQWAGPEGIWTNFFGRLTSTTSIPARLAQKTGALIVPAFCIRSRPGHYRIEFKSPIEVDENVPHWERTITDKLNRILEEEIRKHPSQWLWAHRRWKPKPRFVREDSYSFTSV